jgi:nicotinate dehydrogenase subunit B
MSALPAMLADNPQLDLWVNFAAPGQVTISTGRVESAKVCSRPWRRSPPKSSMSPWSVFRSAPGIPTLRRTKAIPSAANRCRWAAWPCVRPARMREGSFLTVAHSFLVAQKGELTVRDGRILCDGKPTAHDYWSLAPSVVLATDATGTAPRKSVVGRDTARIDQPAKVFGQPVFIHDMKLDGTAHARVVRQPNRGAILASVDERAIRRAAREPIAFVRHGNFFGDRRRQRNGGGGCHRRGECSHDMDWGETPAPLQQEAN